MSNRVMHFICHSRCGSGKACLLQVEAHEKGSRKGSLQGLQGLALLQVGEVLYTANTAGHAAAILCRSNCCHPLLASLTWHACMLLTRSQTLSLTAGLAYQACLHVAGCYRAAIHNTENVCVTASAVEVWLAAEPLRLSHCRSCICIQPAAH